MAISNAFPLERHLIAPGGESLLDSLLSKCVSSLYALLLSTLLIGFFSTAAQAQIAGLTQTDIGNTGAAGTYSYGSGTYTIAGAGTGIATAGASDSFSYVSTQTSGNIELTAKVATQTNTSNYAVAGLMIRDSLSANAAQAVIGVSPANGVNFTYRPGDGATSSTTLGPSIAAPVYLRLVKSGSNIAGYQSSDGVSWSLVGNQQVTMPSSFYVLNLSHRPLDTGNIFVYARGHESWWSRV